MTLYRSGCLAGSQTKPILCSDLHRTSIQAEHTTLRDVCRKDKTMPYGVNVLRSPVLYRAAQRDVCNVMLATAQQWAYQWFAQ